MTIESGGALSGAAESPSSHAGECRQIELAAAVGDLVDGETQLVQHRREERRRGLMVLLQVSPTLDLELLVVAEQHDRQIP